MRETFPKVQFITSTHAPIVIASCDEGDIIRLEFTEDPHNIQHFRDKAPYGWLVEDILEGFMKTFSREPRIVENIETVEQLYIKSLLNQLSDNEKVRLREQVNRLYSMLPESDPAITNVRIRALASYAVGKHDD